jgi:4-hydroxy-tetrahydrodipicolinate reductase
MEHYTSDLQPRIKVGLVGYGRAGRAVAEALLQEPGIELCWVARRHAPDPSCSVAGTDIPILGTDDVHIGDWIDLFPVDALIDFSRSESVFMYGEEVRKRQLLLVNAISHHGEEALAYMALLGITSPVLCSPNITIGINFLMLASRLLRTISPQADVAIIEQHFREKPGISGSAQKLAQALGLPSEAVTSLRLGGIVGHHEVIFGFPHQTLRMTHEAIRREAFGTGAAFALRALSRMPPRLYSFEDLLMDRFRQQLLPPS